MKKLIFSLLVVVSVLSVIGCGSKPPANDGDFKNKEWKLVEVWVDNKNINFDRKELVNHKADHIFTFKVDTANISGTGAPNRYSAPYTVSGKTVSVKPVKATQMASIWQPEKLKEFDFFQYIQNISAWAVNNGKLELTSNTDDGRSVKLIFSM